VNVPAVGLTDTYLRDWSPGSDIKVHKTLALVVSFRGKLSINGPGATGVYHART
jgi:hypothetical protein